VVGLLGTSATLRGGLYQSRDVSGRTWLVPDAAEVDTLVTPGIAAVKSGDLRAGATLLRRAARMLAARGADTLVLACTEIPLVVQAGDAAIPMIDASAALARCTVA
jgi:aspartate racemase